MVKVLFFTHSLNKGGAEKTVRTLSRYINEKVDGMESFACVVYDDQEMHKRVDNLIVMKHKSKPSDPKIIKAFHVLQQIAEMKKIKKKYAIDVCISFLPGADIINVLSGVGEKQIVSVRNEESFFAKNILKKLYVKFRYLRCDGIVALSDRVRQDVINYFKILEKKVVTVHCAASEEKESRECDELFLDFIKGKKVFINVGRLDQQKGQVHLIRAFHEMQKTCDDACLVILGEGELEDKLAHTIDALGMRDKILLMGNQFNPADYMKMSDVFVLSSNVEGMPNVLVEALQCGIPIISTDCGAAKETLTPDIKAGTEITKVINGKYGVLVPTCEGKYPNIDFEYDVNRDISESEKIMAQAMTELINDSERLAEYKQRSIECVQQFDQDYIMKKWVKVIKDII